MLTSFYQFNIVFGIKLIGSPVYWKLGLVSPKYRLVEYIKQLTHRSPFVLKLISFYLSYHRVISKEIKEEQKSGNSHLICPTYF